jgi:hypothetical protein
MESISIAGSSALLWKIMASVFESLRYDFEKIIEN